jgi:hypothetical protein
MAETSLASANRPRTKKGTGAGLTVSKCKLLKKHWLIGEKAAKGKSVPGKKKVGVCHTSRTGIITK